MVGYEPETNQLSSTGYILAGATTGILVRACVQPLDVLKIRFQLQVEPIEKGSSVSKYRGLWHGLATIAKEEHLSAFWKGHVTAQAMTAVYMAAEFATFEMVTKMAAFYLPAKLGERRSVVHFFCGGAAGLVATVVSYPLDIIRTRLIAQAHKKHYRSIYQAIITMKRVEGLRSFGRGMPAAIYHATPQSALHFGCYEAYKQLARATLNTNSVDVACGAAAGFTSKLLVYPFDTAKRRMQVMGFEKAREEFGVTRTYSGVRNFVLVVLREEGVRGLYKGVTWALLKSSVSTSLYFCTYERICAAMKMTH